jgi:hypothetical protein
MANSKRPWKRRQILIDPRFQFHFTVRFGVALLFYALLFFNIAVLAPAVPHMFNGNIPEGAMFAVHERAGEFTSRVLLPLALTFCCIFAHGIHLSFRIAGPNYRFKTVLRDLRQLRFPAFVKVRKGDYLQDTAKLFDGALGALREQLHEVKQRAAAVGEAIRDDDPVGEELRGALAALERSLQAIELGRPSALDRCDWVQLDEEPDEVEAAQEVSVS